MRKRRICIAGEFTFDRLGASWARGFEAIGIEVVRFDIRAESARLGWLARNRIAHRLSIQSYALRHWAARGYNRALYDRVIGADVEFLILHNAAFVFPDTMIRIQRLGVKVIVFYADNPFPPHYNNRPETLPLAREADLTLIWSERLAARLLDAGVRDARFLPFAWDPEVFPYEEPPAKQWEGVLFIGGWDKEREAFLDQVAKRFPLRIYGPGYWGSRTRPGSAVRKCWMGKELTGPEAARTIRKSAICLNILRAQHYVEGKADGLIMRHFEVPGAGGLLLSTRSGGATRLFPEGDLADYFGDIEECLGKIESYLSDATRRRVLISRSHAEIDLRHRYQHRASEVLTIFGTQLRRCVAQVTNTGSGPSFEKVLSGSELTKNSAQHFKGNRPIAKPRTSR